MPYFIESPSDPDRILKLSISIEQSEEADVRHVSGVAIFDKSVGDKAPDIIVNTDQGPVAATWNPERSRRFAKMYRNSLNGGQARFSVDVPPHAGSINSIVAVCGEPWEEKTEIPLANITFIQYPTAELRDLREKLDALVEAPEKADTGVLRKHMKALGALGDELTTPLGQEASIMINGAFRRAPHRTHTAMMNLKQMRIDAGEEDAFAAFSAQFDALIKPDQLTPHSYFNGFATKSHQSIYDHIEALVGRLRDEFGYELTLFAGTLLGVVRDGKLIDYDDDVDLAIYLKGDTLEAVADEWVDLKKRLLDMGLAPDDASNSGHDVIRLTKVDDVQVDVFPAWFMNDQLSVWPYVYGEISRDQVFPLRRDEKNGLPIPQDPELMLATSYGEGWRIPDPYFAFSWPDARKRFAPLFDLVKARL